MSKTHEKWMKLALEQARLAQAMSEVPVGAVLVQDDQLIASTHNQPISNNDPTAHAEIQLLRAAGKQLNNYRLPNTTLYVTLEPCTMCLGAMIHARVSRIVFGAYDQKTGVCGSALIFQLVNVLIIQFLLKAAYWRITANNCYNNSLKTVERNNQ
jgi:tRNA(adenine34) deaminase